MAHYKRKKCRHRTFRSQRWSSAATRAHKGLKPVRVTSDEYIIYTGDHFTILQKQRDMIWPPKYRWMTNPAWWDRTFHTRLHRAANKRMARKVLRDAIDPDDAAWPLRRKPHIWYW